MSERESGRGRFASSGRKSRFDIRGDGTRDSHRGDEHNRPRDDFYDEGNRERRDRPYDRDGGRYDDRRDVRRGQDRGGSSYRGSSYRGDRGSYRGGRCSYNGRPQQNERRGFSYEDRYNRPREGDRQPKDHEPEALAMKVDFNKQPLGFPFPDETESDWLVRRMNFRTEQVERLLKTLDSSNHDDERDDDKGDTKDDGLKEEPAFEVDRRGRDMTRTAVDNTPCTVYDSVSRRIWDKSPMRMPSRSPTPPAIRMERAREQKKKEEERAKLIEMEVELRHKEDKRRKHVERMARIEANKKGEDVDAAVSTALEKFEKERLRIRRSLSIPDDLNNDGDQKLGSNASSSSDSKAGTSATKVNGKSTDSKDDYGGAHLEGEGSAIAAYIKSGKRIPRRGEIGLSSNEITKYEDAGFVMSGSRHKRMNAVRTRKENQVITAEEKKAMLEEQKEERIRREEQIVSELKELVNTRIKSATKKVEKKE